MADVDLGDIVEVQVLGQFKGTDAVENVYQAKMTDPGGGTAAETVDWAKEWILNLTLTIQNELSINYGYEEIQVLNLTQDTFLGQDFSIVGGLGAGDALPPQNCALVMGRTLEPTVDGRKYLGVFIETVQTDGVWSAALRTNLASFGNVWKDEFTSVALVKGQGQVVSKPPLAPIVPRDIQSILVVSGVRTQRRRTLGRGS